LETWIYNKERTNMAFYEAIKHADGIADSVIAKTKRNVIGTQIYQLTDGGTAIVVYSNKDIIFASYRVSPDGRLNRAKLV
jgi:hypothetical protein